ncbi:glycosyltransferase [Mariniblastus fucicola]|uniref:Glycosyltransferase EpsF n=1 Tax=Mariniblastus fucicola TaxID=980251 RepID=A0A5B9P845_9BACT|nr:glycosyltransferase [Mariniblastus fucicola]QEG21669.1 Putative glycosyltransferase EpsF [Mariniblastus fucicola]
MNDSDTRPLNVMFVITSMPVGGAETLLVNLTRRFDKTRIKPMIGCLKEQGVLGDELANEIPVFEHLINHKYDVAVARRLRKLFRKNEVDAVVTVGAGDKMFWGRLSARGAGVPVILSALHSTGWPDGVGRLNRMLTSITDGFIAVARHHAEFLVEFEKFPEGKVFMIPNGIDTLRFKASDSSRQQWRQKVGIPENAPTLGIVAALRPEKNHELFLECASRALKQVPDAHFVIAGDGPGRPQLESLADEKSIADNVHFLGSVSDIPGVLSMLDVFALTSHNEASPVSILEALSCNRPVVATDVGSIKESVLHGATGYLCEPGNAEDVSSRWIELLTDPDLREQMGRKGRAHVVDNSSLDSMTDGYTELIESLYRQKKSTCRRSSFSNSIATWAGSVFPVTSAN